MVHDSDIDVNDTSNGNVRGEFDDKTDKVLGPNPADYLFLNLSAAQTEYGKDRWVVGWYAESAGFNWWPSYAPALSTGSPSIMEKEVNTHNTLEGRLTNSDESLVKFVNLNNVKRAVSARYDLLISMLFNCLNAVPEQDEACQDANRTEAAHVIASLCLGFVEASTQQKLDSWIYQNRNRP
ncbi:hypothetical protein CPC08DRAFT_729520 [Agrocybe pediades]|nr:hypothetical protein CPC08DRAFT_729520 [Agrocybe pediades]